MVNLPNIMIIGLTGISGAGKSTVCEHFARGGFEIVDCDVIARSTAAQSDFLAELQDRFPVDVLNADGSLNREATAKLIFNDSAKLRLYNGIIFPYIIYEIIRRIGSAAGDVVLDAPTLFDCGLDMICQKIIGVVAQRDICAERIMRRDGITENMALERLSIQRGADFFKTHCDYMIENDGSYSKLTENAENIVNKLKGRI